MIHMEEGIKGGEGGRVGGVGEDHEMMHCIHHPHRNNSNNTGGGICAFCLQEKLGKLVSSSFPPNSCSSPPSSFRSSTTTTAPTATSSAPAVASSSSSSLSLSVPPKKNSSGSESDHHNHHEHNMRSRLPFLMAKNKNKKAKTPTNSSSSSSAATSDIIIKRSKSTATPRRDNYLGDADDDDMVINEDLSRIKRNGFWSFLYPSSKSIRGSNGTPRMISSSTSAASGSLSSVKPREKSNIGSSLGRKSDIVVVEEGDNNNNNSSSPYIIQTNASGSSFEGKVSRSRSVGCGGSSSRSLISGDFFERISNGLGDCTLRRVESQREGGKPNKERVSCGGGIFGGFMMMNASSNNSLWAFNSPVRAFSGKTSSKDNKNSDKNSAMPNLSAIPSLLTTRG